MTREITKSINSILYERTTSPFYGTLFLSWLIFNWKIVYLTFFISEQKIAGSKIDYITSNFNDTSTLVWYPLISTVLLLTVFPFISNGAYWLSMMFNNWRIQQKNIIEKKQLLTVEQSIELREQILQQEERFSKLILDKNLEIEKLNTLIEEFQNSNPQNDNKRDSELKELAEKIKSDESNLSIFNNIKINIQSNYRIEVNKEISRILTLLESHDIIHKEGSLYKFTGDGRKFLQYM